MKSVLGNHRAFDRAEVRFPARLKNDRLSTVSDTVIKDVSVEGVRVLISQKVSMFDKLSLVFNLPGQSEPMGFDGHVVWVEKESPKSWHIGVKFEKPDLMKAKIILESRQ